MPRTQNSSKMPNPYWETERHLTGLRRRPVFWQVWVAVGAHQSSRCCLTFASTMLPSTCVRSGPASCSSTIYGAGFSHREWRSLRNVHRSEKRSSPKETGCFGMGSRSYFHYTDIIAVMSRRVASTWVSIHSTSPLATGAGTWEADLTAAAADESPAPRLTPLHGATGTNYLSYVLIRKDKMIAYEARIMVVLTPRSAP